MDPIWLVLAAAGLSLLLSLVCMVVLLKGHSPRSALEDTPLATRRVAEASSVILSPQAEGSSETAAPEVEMLPDTGAAEPRHRLQVKTSKEIKQCLFVILELPGIDTNRRLARLLAEYRAQYDAKLGVYTIRDPLAGYTLTLANASPPGTLPPLHEGGDQPVVGGVSILLHFANKRSVASNPDTLVQITQAVAGLGGRILDAERNAVSVEEFERLKLTAREMAHPG